MCGHGVAWLETKICIFKKTFPVYWSVLAASLKEMLPLRNVQAHSIEKLIWKWKFKTKTQNLCLFSACLKFLSFSLNKSLENSNLLDPIEQDWIRLELFENQITRVIKISYERCDLSYICIVT